MSYDWKDKIAGEAFSREWFDEIDARFIDAARHFAHTDRPFGRIIPFEAIAGKRVLEVGCGMGLHTELMARAGANVTAIDISPEVGRRHPGAAGAEGPRRRRARSSTPRPSTSRTRSTSSGPGA